ncbi:MAG: M1 family metallopeptidase [Taibaiella sp.]|nr:M1 family metallopeptidase [Taibaiella sp.]
MKKIFTSLCLLAISQAQLNAQHSHVSYQYDAGSSMREHTLDFKRMKLQVAFEPEKGLVKGTITHHFTAIREQVDSFFLDGPGIKVKSAMLNGKQVDYKSLAEGISFYPSAPLRYGSNDSLVIEYEAYPRRGIYFIGWNDPNNLSRKQIWTQGQGIDNRHWFPCYDTPNDKLITELIVTFGKEYKVLSNGVKLAEKELKDGNKQWHYKMSKPHASYLVMLGIGKYDIRETRSASGVPLRQWYYPEWKDRYDFTYKYNEKIFNFLEAEIGVPYGWESYSQIPVQDFMYGAMENTSATLFGDFFQTDALSYNDRNYVAVNAHELAHQWFGDMITARSGNSHWLQESFATHYNITAERECFGQDHFDWARRTAYLAAINITDKKSISHSQTPTALIYQKGSVVLEMLKYVTGRAAFNRSVKRYLLAHKYENVDSDDLLNAFEDELGMPLDWFWNQWVLRGGEPDYNVSYDDISTGKNRATQITVTQTHQTNEIVQLFRMPIAFEVHYTDGTSDKTSVTIEKETHVVKIANTRNKDIAFVLFDPNSQVLKTVTFEKPFEMLKAQALSAPHMLDRYDAVYAMRSIAADKKRELMKQVYEANTYHAIKTEIATQLLGDKGSEHIVRMALRDKNVQVRKGVISNTKNIETALLADYELLLKDSSYVTIATALEKLCIAAPANTTKYLAATKGIEGTNGKNVLIKWLEIAAAESGDINHINQLVSYTSGSYEFITRGNAMAALRRLNHCDTALIANCLTASLSSNGRLAGPAAETVKYFYAQHKYKKQIADAIANSSVTGKDKEALGRLLN